MFFARCEQPAGSGGGAGDLPPALPLVGDETGTTERQRVFVLQPEAVSRAAGDVQGALPGTGANPPDSGDAGGTFEHFITERSCLFSSNRVGQPIRASLHYIPWPLEDAEADIERNDLAGSIGIELPNVEPVLHYSRRLAVYVWPAELVRPVLAGRPVTVAASPTG